MELAISAVLAEYAKQGGQYEDMAFEDLSPLLEKAMEEDFKRLLNLLGIVGNVKPEPNTIPYKTMITSKHRYRFSWLMSGYVRFQEPFHHILKELLNKNISKMRFNVSLSIIKVEQDDIRRGYYDFTFRFKYFERPTANNTNS